MCGLLKLFDDELSPLWHRRGETLVDDAQFSLKMARLAFH